MDERRHKVTTKTEILAVLARRREKRLETVLKAVLRQNGPNTRLDNERSPFSDGLDLQATA